MAKVTMGLVPHLPHVPLTDDQVDKLVNDLARPIYNYRMSYGTATWSRGVPPRQVKSAQTRLRNARAEIKEIVSKLGTP